MDHQRQEERMHLQEQFDDCSSKARIACKKEGDGFLLDCWCDDVHTFSFHFRNESPPKKHRDLGMSPLHSRCLSLMDDSPEKCCCCWYDDLRTTLPCIMASQERKSCAMIEGACSKGRSGLPESTHQEEVKKKEDLQEVIGIIKTASFK